MQRYGIRLRSKDGTGAQAEKTWIGEHLGAREVQALASRSYRATNEHLLRKRGRPRFKGKGRLHAMEGKGPESGLRRTNNNLVVCGDLALQPRMDPSAAAALAETHRRLAEGPKTAQGTLANSVLAMGDVLQIESLVPGLSTRFRAFGGSASTGNVRGAAPPQG